MRDGDGVELKTRAAVRIFVVEAFSVHSRYHKRTLISSFFFLRERAKQCANRALRAAEI